ncbi:Fibrinogen C domain-containing protein 1 [Holothuria leucospilota]|uniref:Fibrinogen C domain-containing protein 1 n=1 Tax=Holothuria leucospilota TaxID=206669 RepID=A0A9Q1BU40_HOLLE|nr:Fibrinogen C domain-containing protein 1 [Holothuria leucospilota]
MCSVTVKMSYLRYTDKFFIFLLSCIYSLKGISTQDGSSYFFYQQPEYPRDCKEARDQCSSDNLSGVYTIKPDGYPQPFEVYCNNDIASGGWTVIQRRLEGSLAFNRNWDDYKNGFGFVSDEFWIGNDKLSYLTNQAMFELRIDMMLSNGSSIYVKYKSFRISDGFSGYTLVNTAGFTGNLSCAVSTCPPETTHRECSCQQSCDDPLAITDCHEECVESCVPTKCYVSEKNAYILSGESYINTDCSKKCTCIDNQVSCNPDYECSPDASCLEIDSLRKCYCNVGYVGDGETCTTLYTDCYDAYEAGHRQDGVYTILPTGWSGSPFNVSCDMSTAGGGWTIFQRRTDGVTDFYRYWDDFKNGFGSLDQGKDFWLGNEQVHYMTNQKAHKLRVDIRTYGNEPLYAEYASFRISDENSNYRLSTTGYSGDAGNNLAGCESGGQFSTRDRDNDGCSVHHFAQRHRGAWWHSRARCPLPCTECNNGYGYCDYFETRSGCSNKGTGSNLNGEYQGSNGESIFWSCNYNLNFAEMKIRPSSV